MSRVLDPIYGAVTTGDLWRFGILTPSDALIRKDVNSFLIPQDLDALATVLAGILAN